MNVIYKMEKAKPKPTSKPKTSQRLKTPKGRAATANRRLKLEYSNVKCALNHRSPFQLLVATILSAQCTDKRVNMVTPALFKKYSTPAKLAAARMGELCKLIHSTGFYRSKAKNLISMAQSLVADYGGKVPNQIEDLVKLGGVGRKTANVILSVAMGKPGLPVDTHVKRLSNRIGMTQQTDPVKIEMELNPFVPAKERGDFSLRLIQHGREVCFAKRPVCDGCVLNDYCPSAFSF